MLAIIRRNSELITEEFKGTDLLLRQKVNWRNKLGTKETYYAMCIAVKSYEAELWEMYNHKPKTK